ncbi:MAG: hypothetical protein WD423_00325 [Rhodothermales bacterium]
MFTGKVIGTIALMFVLAQASYAQGIGDIQEYFNDTAISVKATDDPAQKRDLVDNSLRRMSEALDRIDRAGLVSADNRAGVDRLATSVQDKRDELAGRNGYNGVPDAQLNAFADYVVQDMEQADRTITISLVTALLLVIILILVT